MRLRRNVECRSAACLCGENDAVRRARRVTRWLLGLALAGVAIAGACARADDLVLEAAFLADPVPAAGTDLNLLLGVSQVEGGTGSQQRAQLATRLAPGLGLAAEGGVAIGPAGEAALAPFAASLKLALAEPGEGPAGLGVHACADLQSDPAEWAGSEAGLGLGLSRGLGPVTLRGTAWAMSAVGRWDPHAHAGLSAAVALGARARLLLEAVADLRAHGSALGAGPTLKVEVAPGTTLAAGALLAVAPWAGVAQVQVQAGRSF